MPRLKEISRADAPASVLPYYDALFGKSDEEEEASTMKKKKTIAQLRVQVLEDQLRPVLFPEEKWSDVFKWRWNARVVKWVRKEFLVAKYGPEVKVWNNPCYFSWLGSCLIFSFLLP